MVDLRVVAVTSIEDFVLTVDCVVLSSLLHPKVRPPWLTLTSNVPCNLTLFFLSFSFSTFLVWMHVSMWCIVNGFTTSRFKSPGPPPEVPTIRTFGSGQDFQPRSHPSIHATPCLDVCSLLFALVLSFASFFLAAMVSGDDESSSASREEVQEEQ